MMQTIATFFSIAYHLEEFRWITVSSHLLCMCVAKRSCNQLTLWNLHVGTEAFCLSLCYNRRKFYRAIYFRTFYSLRYEMKWITNCLANISITISFLHFQKVILTYQKELKMKLPYSKLNVNVKSVHKNIIKTHDHKRVRCFPVSWSQHEIYAYRWVNNQRKRKRRPRFTFPRVEPSRYR